MRRGGSEHPGGQYQTEVYLGGVMYDVILADPPWTFSVWNADKSDRHVSHKYPIMETNKIATLPICDLVNDDAILFLWATWPNLKDALLVLDLWGFEYKTIGWTWVKAKRSGFGFHFGMGYYTRANTEPCLLAVRGTMPVARHDIQALIYSPVREHSRKPDEQYAKIEKLYPNKRYLELFARHKREGWDAWGNEVESDVEL